MTDAVYNQEIETDVVVVGYGSAGGTAAITAHDNGAKVIILEKMPSGGGNTRLSGGALFTPKSLEVVPYIDTLCSGSTEKEIIETFIENALQTEDWIHQIGGEAVPRSYLEVFYPPLRAGAAFPKVLGAEHTTRLFIKGNDTEPAGERLFKLLATNVERRGIKVMTNTAAKELVTNREGAVTGVVAEKDGNKVLVKAKRAVILTCGGFEYNEAMKEAFLPCRPFYAIGNPGNTGDGIIMTQKVGAALWHMTVVEAYLGFKSPMYQAAFRILYHDEGFIYVNRQGKRFCNETGLEAHDGWRDVSQVDSREYTSHPGYSNIPAYGVFDNVTRRKGPLFKATKPSGGYNRDYQWSLDNSQEIAKGWITQAKTVRELAKRISVDEASLENTVASYNECCKAGKDADFGRSRETLRTLETPPFHAIELWPSMLNTQGGPRRDKQARVLNYEGKPIPRLYSAGELGSIWGLLYHGGGNLAECLAFGRIAGRNAAAERPWS